MKNLVFSALVIAAFAGSAFASNEVVLNDNLKNLKEDSSEKVFGACYLTVSGRAKDGSTYSDTFSWNSKSSTDCSKEATNKLTSLENEGYDIQTHDNKYVANGVIKG